MIALVADFETTTTPNDCRVWGWGMADVSHNPRTTFGTDIDSFMSEALSSSWIVYFHNLQFDGSFILSWLLRNGYSHTVECTMREKEFSTIISDTGKFYSIKVQAASGIRVEFRDSLKVIPMSVAAIPKAFGLTNESKGVIDYEAPRPIGYMPTEEEWDYIESDIVIVAKALAQQHDEGIDRLTIGSSALKDFKSMHTKQWWDTLFPVLDNDTDTDIRRAYRGGFTYASPRFQKRVVGPVKVYDVNSLYPYIMRERQMPIGVPEFVEGKPEATEEYPLFVARIVFTAKLKDGMIPCIQIKGTPFFAATEYQTDISEPVDLWATSVDIALWSEHYDLDILAWVCAYRFRATVGPFNEYIDKWSKVKAESTGGRRTISKLFLNSLYGKFATNPRITGKIPFLDGDGILRFRMGEEEMRDPVYTPVGVFITAWARDKTIRAAQSHYDVFAYADTDSLHLVTSNEPSDLDIDPKRLGAWKHEGDFDLAFFGRAKCYTEYRSPDEWDTHIAGMPKAIAKQVRFEHYDQETEFSGKLVPRQVPGGVVLEDVGFTLKV